MNKYKQQQQQQQQQKQRITLPREHNILGIIALFNLFIFLM